MSSSPGDWELQKGKMSNTYLRKNCRLSCDTSSQRNNFNEPHATKQCKQGVATKERQGQIQPSHWKRNVIGHRPWRVIRRRALEVAAITGTQGFQVRHCNATLGIKSITRCAIALLMSFIRKLRVCAALMPSTFFCQTPRITQAREEGPLQSKRKRHAK